MTIDLSAFLDGANKIIQIQGELKENSLNLGYKNYVLTKPIKYDGNVFKVDGEILIQANILFTFEDICDRCLKPTIIDGKTVLSGKLIEGTGEVCEEDEGYDEVIYYKDDTLDIHNNILDQVALALPMKSLCNPQCKGLCPKCGADLNENTCSCVLNDIDPRLEKLKDFFLK